MSQYLDKVVSYKNVHIILLPSTVMVDLGLVSLSQPNLPQRFVVVFISKTTWACVRAPMHMLFLVGNIQII